MTKYRIYSSKLGHQFQYHWKYFDDIDDAIVEAQHLESMGLIEQWEVNTFENKKDDFIDITCEQCTPFDFTDLNIKDKIWKYERDQVIFICPGEVFNYYKKNIDKDITLEEISELVKDKQQHIVS
jgi:hypothetical protein